ncbi:response regulator transcription factor [Actinomadura rudentiformis]|uniref:Response regulator transcription factor n=1 Tax=Actinomadura rudentiformis TaxID=359158 RepID=A0A6H9YEQ9_9ACTN|nr:response regulator transcription factor [Actinomadura rudentiformis]KAB2339837.1 response regulator transcription factor [Actinomadura rudentiformis]
MIRVLIADDMHLLRSGLVALLDGEPDISVAATVECGGKLVAAARGGAPQVALIDIDLTDMDGFKAARLLRDQMPGCAVIIMADRCRAGDLRRAVAAGADGFLLKDTSPADLVDAIRRVADGERVIDGGVAFAELGEGKTDSPLTPREVEVLKAAAEGCTVGEIAQRLYLASGTVSNYLSRILTKIDARTRVEAVAIAKERGWLWPDEG